MAIRIKPVGIGDLASARALRVFAFLSAMVAAVAFGVVLQSNYPVADNAMFEYVGRALAQGHTLYRDIWDNKLPGIYFVNAAWYMFFGSNYVVHTLAEACVAVLSSAVLVGVMRSFGLPLLLPIAFLLTALLCVVTPLNATETYAVPLLLGAVLAAKRELPLVAGLLVAVACTFWLPSLLIALPLSLLLGRRSFTIFAATCAGGIAALFGMLAWCVGVPQCVLLIRSWEAYVTSAPPTYQDYHLAALNRLSLGVTILEHAWGGFLTSGAAPLCALLAAVVRKPSTDAQRFGLLWSGAMLLGTVTGTRFFSHYFTPALPALLFTIGAYADAFAFKRWKAVVMLLAVALMAFTVQDAVTHWLGARDRAAADLRVSNAVRAMAGRGVSIQTDSYQPGLYLAIQPKLRSPYEIAAPANFGFVQAMGIHMPAGDVIIDRFSARPAGSPICAHTAQPFHVFAATPHIAALFRSCR